MKTIFTLMLLAVLGTAGAQSDTLLCDCSGGNRAPFDATKLIPYLKTSAQQYSPPLYLNGSIEPDTIPVYYKEIVLVASMPLEVWRKGYRSATGNYLDRYKKPVTGHVVLSIPCSELKEQ